MQRTQRAGICFIRTDVVAASEGRIPSGELGVCGQLHDFTAADSLALLIARAREIPLAVEHLGRITYTSFYL